MWEWELTHSDEEEEKKKHIAIVLLSTGFGESYCQLGDEIDESDESDSDNYIDDNTNVSATYRRSIFTVTNMTVGKSHNNKLV